MLAICAWCKKIRNDEGLWQYPEVYLRDHSEVQFSHGMCPECAEKQRVAIGRETPNDLLP
jgi:hypothetical protein